MKKRAMKKWIPKGTPYCNNCKWHKYIKTIKYHRDTYCPHAKECEEKCWTTFNTSCHVNVYRCEYLKYTDWNEDSLLWDGCKECGVSEISNKEYYFDKYYCN